MIDTLVWLSGWAAFFGLAFLFAYALAGGFR